MKESLSRDAWRSFRSTLLMFIERRVPDPELSQIILQELCLRIQVRGPFLPDSENLGFWFYRLVRNTILDVCTVQGVKCQAPLPEEGMLCSGSPDGLEALYEARQELNRSLEPIVEAALLQANLLEAFQTAEGTVFSESGHSLRDGVSKEDQERAPGQARRQVLGVLLDACAREWKEHELVAIRYENLGNGFYC